MNSVFKKHLKFKSVMILNIKIKVLCQIDHLNWKNKMKTSLWKLILKHKKNSVNLILITEWQMNYIQSFYKNLNVRFLVIL